MPVEEVGAGVGYEMRSSSMAVNLRLLGRHGGDDEKGSKAGSSSEGCRVRSGRALGVVMEWEFRGLGLFGD